MTMGKMDYARLNQHALLYLRAADGTITEHSVWCMMLGPSTGQWQDEGVPGLGIAQQTTAIGIRWRSDIVDVDGIEVVVDGVNWECLGPPVFPDRRRSAILNCLRYPGPELDDKAASLESQYGGTP